MRRLPVLLALLCCGCGEQASREAGRPEPAVTGESRSDERPAIVAFGDSLTAGHGSGAEHPYTEFLQQELDRRGLRYRVVNAGVSGDTSGSGLERVETVAERKPAFVIVEFGGNDGLRGLPVATTRANLEEMIVRLQSAGARVVLAGMTLPPNYGPDYIRSFERVYTELAAKHHLPLIPFLLEGVGGQAAYMQADGIHPNVQGNRLVAANVLRVLEPLLGKP